MHVQVVQIKGRAKRLWSRQKPSGEDDRGEVGADVQANLAAFIDHLLGQPLAITIDEAMIGERVQSRAR